MNAASSWSYKQEIPSREQFTAYMERQGFDAAGYDAWVARAQTVKANNAALVTAKRADVPSDTKVEDAAALKPVDPAASAPTDAPADAPADAPTDAPTDAVGQAEPEMPHQRPRSKAAPYEVMSVRVRPGIGERIDAYRAQYRASKQDVVSDILDGFLTRHGF